MLPLKSLPDIDSDYAAFRESELTFRTQEYSGRIRYPTYKDTGHTVPFSRVKMGEEFDGSDCVYKATIYSEDAIYVYKGLEKDIYIPMDTEVMKQELRNLKLFRGNKNIVQLIAPVVSNNPYLTELSHDDSTLVLRGMLLEYHPNGSLRDAIRAREPWMDSRWRRWALEIIQALSDLHQQGVTHMDLKPKNIVMSTRWSAILIDISGIGGITREWVLPELLDVADAWSANWEDRVRSDIWALGRILSSMAEAACSHKEKLILFETAQAIERAVGGVPLSTITGWLFRSEPLYQNSEVAPVNGCGVEASIGSITWTISSTSCLLITVRLIAP